MFKFKNLFLILSFSFIAFSFSGGVEQYANSNSLPEIFHLISFKFTESEAMCGEKGWAQAAENCEISNLNSCITKKLSSVRVSPAGNIQLSFPQAPKPTDSKRESYSKLRKISESYDECIFNGKGLGWKIMSNSISKVLEQNGYL